MKRVKVAGKSHRFMGRLLAGMTAAAVFVSSLPFQGMRRSVNAKETETGGLPSKEPEVRSVNLNIGGKIAGLKTRLCRKIQKRNGPTGQAHIFIMRA